MSENQSILAKVGQMQDLASYRDLHWEGSFDDYLEIVRQDPAVTRAAYQRLYDMIISHGCEEYTHPLQVFR